MSATEAAGPEVLVGRSDGIIEITINRPQQRNAMTLTAAELIAQALAELDDSDELSVGILTGAGGTFCAGMDLKRFAAGEVPRVPGRGFGGLTQASPAKPLIAAVEGWALGGGFELMLACDMAIAGRGARLGLPEVKRGLIARGGGALRLPRRLPRAVALELLLTGDPIEPERAEHFGLVNAVVPEGEALGAARELARRIAENAPPAVTAAKRLAADSEDWPLGELFVRQAPITEPVMNSTDAAEGARAFAERRAPVWQGR